MFKIYIDSSKRYEKSVVLKNSDGIVVDGISGDIDIVESIKKLLGRNKLELSEVEFDFFEGPGDSFTGLKVGSVISNLLNWSNGKIDSTKPKLPNYGREPNISERKGN